MCTFGWWFSVVFLVLGVLIYSLTLFYTFLSRKALECMLPAMNIRSQICTAKIPISQGQLVALASRQSSKRFCKTIVVLFNFQWINWNYKFVIFPHAALLTPTADCSFFEFKQVRRENAIFCLYDFVEYVGKLRSVSFWIVVK